MKSSNNTDNQNNGNKHKRSINNINLIENKRRIVINKRHLAAPIINDNEKAVAEKAKSNIENQRYMHCMRALAA